MGSGASKAPDAAAVAGKEKDWKNQTKEERAAVKQLGWTEKSWQKGVTEPLEKPWNEIDQAAAAVLGYTRASWSLSPQPEPQPEPEPEPEPTGEPEPESPPPDPVEVYKDGLATELGRGQIDPLLRRYDELADDGGELMKADLVRAIPALERSLFFKAIADMLVEDGKATAHKAGSINKKTFIRVLARFAPGAPLEPKLRGMFEIFRSAGGGVQENDRLSRAGVSALLNALYPNESQTMLEVMVTGLMQGVGTTENGARVITYQHFNEACSSLDDIDALLTLTFPKIGSAEAAALSGRREAELVGIAAAVAPEAAAEPQATAAE